ncbi:MAG: hypothetical protein MUF87_08470 [Anaerolineae bacterium]|nr:hypothetical protein [Anaerolineae bacterium]
MRWFSAIVLTLLGLVSAPISFAQTNFCRDAQDIAYGDLVENEIDNRNYLYYACFEGEQGDRVMITMDRTSGDLDTYLWLSSPTFSRVYVYSDNFSRETTNSRVEYVLPADDQYLITMTRINLQQGETEGDFQLNLFLDREDDGQLRESLDGRNVDGFNICDGRGQLIEYGDTVEGEITEDQRLQPFCFQATAGDHVRVEMRATRRSDLIPYLVIEEATLTQTYVQNGNPERTSQAVVEYIFSEDDLYLITASRFDEEFGEFELTLTLLSSGNLGRGRRTESQTPFNLIHLP